MAQTIAAALFGPATFELWSTDYQTEILEAADAVLAAAGAKADAGGGSLSTTDIADAVAHGLDDSDGRETWPADYTHEMDGVAAALVPLLRGDRA